jgi:Trypsin
MLLAAHCVSRLYTGAFSSRNVKYEKELEDKLKIVLGDWKLGQDKDCDDDYDETLCDPPIEVQAEAVAIHKQFNPKTYANDLALIKLVAPLKYTTLIQPACLPLSTTRYNKMNIEGKTLTGVGFGLQFQFLNLLPKITIHFICRFNGSRVE